MTKIYIYTYDTHEARDDARDRFFRACLTDYLNTKGNTKGTFFFVSQGSIPEEAGTQKEPSLLCTFGEHGKPRFAAPELADVHFSVSHSGDYLAIAFSEQEVGVDVEHTSRRHTNAERYLAIARRFFAPDEGAYVAGGDAEDTVTAPEDVKRRFFRIWTAKEAFVKYTGEGIATGFETFSVLDDTEGTFFSVSQDLDVEEAGAQKRTSLLCSLLCSLVRETPDMVCAVCAHDDEAVVAEPPPPAAKKRQPVRDKALSLLAKHDRTEQQMRESLARSGYGEEEVQGTIDFLKEYGYIDDEAYAGKYLRELIRKGRGRWRIRGDMLRHGLESEVVEETLRNGYPREEELALARAAAGKAARSLPEGTPPHERARRVSQKLSAQGFDYDVISNAIDTLSLIE